MKLFSWLVSLTIHGLILWVGAFSIQPAVVGITQGRQSMKIQLAVVPRQSSTAPYVSSPSSLPPTFAPRASSLLHPVVSSKPLTPHPRQSSSVKKTPIRSPNSRRMSREHFVSSATGAIVDREPDYLSNPPPVYPQAAQEQQQQGLVVLDVVVSTDGRPETVKIFSESGYYLLDKAACKAVQNYRFRPAMVNGMQVRSHVRVPIRFRLDR